MAIQRIVVWALLLVFGLAGAVLAAGDRERKEGCGNCPSTGTSGRDRSFRSGDEHRGARDGGLKAPEQGTPRNREVRKDPGPASSRPENRGWKPPSGNAGKPAPGTVGNKAPADAKAPSAAPRHDRDGGKPVVREPSTSGRDGGIRVVRKTAEPRTRMDSPRPSVASKTGTPRTVHRGLDRIAKPPSLRHERNILRTPRERSFAPPPARDPRGGRFAGTVAHRPPPTTVNVFNNTTIINHIDRIARIERTPGRHTWHRHGGMDYCHYYDHSGFHWYGWYVGVNFYWTRWHAGLWWWYDRTWDRWCYWNSGYWWWPRADRPDVVYVYVNNEYVLPSEAPAEVPVALPVEPREEPARADDQYYRNQRMDRMVRIYGPDRDAFLYDASEKQSFRPIFLASGVKEVRMSDDGDGKALQILVEKIDGSFEIFDARGNPYLPARPKDG